MPGHVMVLPGHLVDESAGYVEYCADEDKEKYDACRILHRGYEIIRSMYQGRYEYRELSV